MFTGIVQAAAPILSASSKGNTKRVRVRLPASWKLAIGQSVAVDGICSTVVQSNKQYFEVEYMPETLSKTIAGSYAAGAAVNLERSLTLKDFVDGHLVSGHIDTRGIVVRAGTGSEGYLIVISVPASLMRYIAVHGSVAVNGVSLTVARTRGSTFTVALIPHTLAHTNLRFLKKRNHVNIEVDLVARYVVAAAERGGRVAHNAKKRSRKSG